MKPLGTRVVRGWVALHHRPDDPTAMERLLDESHGPRATDCKGRHRLRKDDCSAQGQNPQHIRNGRLLLVALSSHMSPFDLEQIDGLELARCRSDKSLSRLLRPPLTRCLATILAEVGDQILDLLLHFHHAASHL